MFPRYNFALSKSQCERYEAGDGDLTIRRNGTLGVQSGCTRLMDAGHGVLVERYPAHRLQVAMPVEALVGNFFPPSELKPRLAG